MEILGMSGVFKAAGLCCGARQFPGTNSELAPGPPSRLLVSAAPNAAPNKNVGLDMRVWIDGEERAGLAGGNWNALAEVGVTCPSRALCPPNGL